MDVHTYFDVHSHANVDTYPYSHSHCYAIAYPGAADEYPQTRTTESSGTDESASRESGSYKSAGSHKSTAGDSAFATTVAHNSPTLMNVLHHRHDWIRK
jgi:hypothetical protein